MVASVVSSVVTSVMSSVVSSVVSSERRMLLKNIFEIPELELELEVNVTNVSGRGFEHTCNALTLILLALIY